MAGVSLQLCEQKWRLLLAAAWQDWLGDGKPSFTDGVNYDDHDNDDNDDDDNGDDDKEGDGNAAAAAWQDWLGDRKPSFTNGVNYHDDDDGDSDYVGLCISSTTHYLAIGQQGGVVKDVWDQAEQSNCWLGGHCGLWIADCDREQPLLGVAHLIVITIVWTTFWTPKIPKIHYLI